MISTFLWTLRRLRALLPGENKRQLVSLFAVIITTSVVDIFGLAVFIPVIAVVVDPGILENDNIVSTIQTFSGIEDPGTFTLALFLSALFFFLIRSIFIVWSQHRQASFSFDLSENMARKTLTYLLDLPYGAFSKRDSNKMIRELNTNPQQFSRFLIMQLLLIISEMIVVFTIVLGIALYNVTVFLLVIVSLLPAAFIFHRVVKKRVESYGLQQNELIPKLQEITYQAIFGYVDIKLRDKSGYIIENFGKNVNTLNHIGKRIAVLNILPAKLFELLTMVGLFVIFCYGYYISNRPELILPILTIYLTASYRLIPSLGKVIPAMMNLNQYRHLFDIFEGPLNSTREPATRNEEVRFERDIELRELTFSFDVNTPLLVDLNILLKKGETLGIIGKSGSGKTTFVQLLLGFYKPLSGKIFIDGEELNDHLIKSWRSKIGYVQQSHFLIRGSLTENIAYGETPETVDRVRLENSIRNACLDEFTLGRNPADILVDEYGKNLSGGQKQRIAIARALYHNVELLILDEATSALDIQTEQEINQTIKILKDLGLTLIIVAHRFTTLKHADNILQLQDGKILRNWTYSELEEEAISY